MRRLAYLAVFVLLDGASAQSPIALHPENGHYFLWRSKPTILVTSGEHYGAVLNLDFDFDTYLKTLAKDGLNHTRVFSGTYREVESSFGITDNPLAPKPGRFLCPWARSQVPGCADGGNKFDLCRFDNTYFGRLKELMCAAAQAGVVVELNLFCPLYKNELWIVSPMNVRNNVNGLGDCPRDETLSLKHPDLVEAQLSLTRKIVGELNAFDNLYYEICNEPYVRKVPDDWQHRIADEIIATEKSLPQKHLISLNVANGRARVEKPHPGISIFNFHYCVPPDVVAMNYDLGKVIGENETGFRGKHDFLYRSEAWDFLLAGGGLYNNLDYSFTPSHPEGDFLSYSSPGGGSPALRAQLGLLKRFMESFDFPRMKPDPAVLLDLSDGLHASILAERGKSYAIYVRVPIPARPKQISDFFREVENADLVLDLEAGQYQVEWLSPSSGLTVAKEVIVHDGRGCRLKIPSFSNDIAARLVSWQGTQ